MLYKPCHFVFGYDWIDACSLMPMAADHGVSVCECGLLCSMIPLYCHSAWTTLIHIWIVVWRSSSRTGCVEFIFCLSVDVRLLLKCLLKCLSHLTQPDLRNVCTGERLEPALLQCILPLCSGNKFLIDSYLHLWVPPLNLDIVILACLVFTLSCNFKKNAELERKLRLLVMELNTVVLQWGGFQLVDW